MTRNSRGVEYAPKSVTSFLSLMTCSNQLSRDGVYFQENRLDFHFCEMEIFDNDYLRKGSFSHGYTR